MPAIAIWSPEDEVLGAVAPLALAAAAGTALVVDLDPEGDRYPGEATLASLVAEGPTQEDLTPSQRGVAVVGNGLHNALAVERIAVGIHVMQQPVVKHEVEFIGRLPFGDVSFDGCQLQSSCRSACAGYLQRRGHEIETGYVPVFASEVQGIGAGAATDVQCFAGFTALRDDIAKEQRWFIVCPRQLVAVGASPIIDLIEVVFVVYFVHRSTSPILRIMDYIELYIILVIYDLFFKV